MSGTATQKAGPLPEDKLSDPSDPIPELPLHIRQSSLTRSSTHSERDADKTFSNTEYASDVDSSPSTPLTENDLSDASVGDLPDHQHGPPTQTRGRRASTVLLSENVDRGKLFGKIKNAATTDMIQKACCGGGCCMLKEIDPSEEHTVPDPVHFPDNDAFKSLNMRMTRPLGLRTELTGLADVMEKTISFETLGTTGPPATQHLQSTPNNKHPPNFVKPHPPYDVFSAKLHHARELTKPGAEKRTFHFDIDVTDYPKEGGDVDFVVGGAIGVCAPNPTEMVEQLLNRLGVPKHIRDKPILLKTTRGRWPTIWGEDEARELITTRRELLTWCTDIQSYPPTKALFRLFADHATDEHEKKLLLYLSSSEGQASFCDLRTGPYLTIHQLLCAFPSTTPPLDHLLSSLNQLMPRFYSLSQDPSLDHGCPHKKTRRLIEVAVSVHESPDWQSTDSKDYVPCAVKGVTPGTRTGIGSGFLERLALQYIQAKEQGKSIAELDLRIPMFRGLMANPLAREFVTDGPMLLIGAGVGIAPFRGFVHRRLKSANCANKVWVLQGIRDSLVDELYKGDWGVEEEKVKKVVQSRKAESKYVQDEVRHQADLVWFIINALDGRVFVCGSTKGMGEGVEAALVDVAMGKGGLNEEDAKAFWEKKKTAGQYIAETW